MAKATLNNDNRVLREVVETIVSTPKSITLELSISQAARIANLIGNTSDFDADELNANGGVIYRQRREVRLMEIYKPLSDALDSAGFRVRPRN